jgi:hypothetical protein
VELAIVLTIIGLIVGGVLAGSNLLAAARVRAAINQVEQFKTATRTFKLKYDGLPGDYCKAQNFGFSFRWCSNRGAGDSNGVIENRWQAGVDSTTIYGEELVLYWIDLTVAGLITEGLDPSVTYVQWFCADTTCRPRTKLNQAMFSIVDKSNRNYFFIGQQPPGSFAGAFIYPEGTTTPAQTKMWDDKMDDGIPSTGKISTLQTYIGTPLNADVPAATACTTSATVYNVTSSYGDKNLCALLIDMEIN